MAEMNSADEPRSEPGHGSETEGASSPVTGRKPETEPIPPRKPRRWLKKAVSFLLILGAVFCVVLFFWLSKALYHRFYRFPREEAAWKSLRLASQPVPPDPTWKEFRGILHSHSTLSHDSEVPFEEILQAMQAARLDFICLSDHCDEGRADFSVQWRGVHKGKMFIPGFEMKEGIMPFGVKSSVVLSNRTDSAVLARQVIENGGVLFYAHPEEPRAWERPELTGMEIYNIHADFKAIKSPLMQLLPELLVNQTRFPDQVFRTIFLRPSANLRRWDELNQDRHITGIAGNDCHQNTGFRGFVTGTNTIYVEDTSPRKVAVVKLNWFTRPIAAALWGPLTPGRKVFHFQLDPYARMARYVNTHVLAKEISETAILDALRHGRVFVGFDMIADSSTFQWFFESESERTVMGEETVFAPGKFKARSPLPCRFTVLKNGMPVLTQESRELAWAPSGPGKYRVEAELKILNEWVPWVYANPIRLR
jgi:hypothetical protein